MIDQQCYSVAKSTNGKVSRKKQNEIKEKQTNRRPVRVSAVCHMQTIRTSATRVSPHSLHARAQCQKATTCFCCAFFVHQHHHPSPLLDKLNHNYPPFDRQTWARVCLGRGGKGKGERARSQQINKKINKHHHELRKNCHPTQFAITK